MRRGKKLKLAVIGTGYFSRFHFEAWSRIEDIEIVAVCSREPENARIVAAKYGVSATFDNFATMLDAVKPDLVDIITPPNTHLDCISAAATRGISIICQKPFCQTIEEAEQAVESASNAGALLVVHENFRFQPWFHEVKRLLGKQALGEVYQAAFRLRPGDGQGSRAYLDRQPYFQQMEQFLVRETGIHFIDVFRYLFGEVTGVYAQLVQLNPVIMGEDAGYILFDFASGMRGLFDGNRLVDHAARNRRQTMGEMLIEGRDGVLRMDGDGRLFLRVHGCNAEDEIDYTRSDRGFGGDCVYALQSHVVAHLLDQGPIDNTGRDYLANLNVEAAVYRSNAARRWIDMSFADTPPPAS